MARSTRKVAARGPGRPPAGSADQRERLLEAALRSFADEGIGATSLRALARETGLTPAMLNYYFGTKDRLIDAVIAERLMPVIAELKQRMAAIVDQDPAKTMLVFVSGLYEAIDHHPWLPALWVREVLSDNGHLRDVFIERIAPEIALPLCEQIKRAQSRHEINARLDPRLLFVSLIGLTLFPFAAAPIWRRVFQAPDIGPERMLEHTLALLESGIEVSHEA